MTTFIFMRHGETEATVHNLASGGGTDAELTEKGRIGTMHACYGFFNDRKKPGATQVDLVLSSGMRRTIPFAQHAISYQIPVFHDARLKEKHAGILEGASVKDMQSTGLLEKFWEPKPGRLFHVFGEAPPGGESHVKLWERVSKALADWSQLFPGKTILVGSHSDIIRVLKALVRANNGNKDLSKYYFAINPGDEPKNEELRAPVHYFESIEIEFLIKKTDIYRREEEEILDRLETYQ